MATSTPQPKSVSILIFLKKREDLTHEEFYRYWLDTHVHLYLAIPQVKATTLSIHQYRQHASLTEAFKGYPTLEWDGVTELEHASYDDFVAITRLPEWDEIVMPDLETFADMSKCQFMIGEQRTSFRQEGHDRR
ncbi:hypothetical protein BOTBODRAFT_45842 [Botryobasidium botryosum FD-172 SS1]|uniref:EthD domain-containing protein n=1 Tax=Botryobasidium botryosum (strain FD-172 SS1) TaxID=930990 RepID=A0A067MKU5_BOTB1|nr:hypothetical protein BOTBODRAFT_45842 [Botryobasidium botryosum FD-172 SS1]